VSEPEYEIVSEVAENLDRCSYIEACVHGTMLACVKVEVQKNKDIYLLGRGHGCQEVLTLV